jgi:hypothetical protein
MDAQVFACRHRLFVLAGDDDEVSHPLGGFFEGEIALDFRDRLSKAIR